MDISEGLKRLIEFAEPATLRRLMAAGVVDVRTPFAIGAAIPWLLGTGPSLGILSHMNAFVLSTKPALVDEKGTLTWFQLEARANRAARALRHLGVREGRSVATLLRNGREAVEIILATQKLGIPLIPLNTWASPEEIGDSLGRSNTKVLIFDHRHADQANAPAGSEKVSVGQSSSSDLEYEGLIANQSPLPLSPLSFGSGSAQVVIQTSGTSGRPKGAARDAASAGISALSNFMQVVPYRRDDVFSCPPPLFHSFGLLTFTITLALGATIVLADRFDPEDFLSSIERNDATAVSLLPVMIRRIMKLPIEVRAKYDVSHLRIVLASGSFMSAELREEASDQFGPIIYDLYGSTEAGWVSVATPEDMLIKPNSVGRPLPGVDISIVDDRGKVAEAHAHGRIALAGDMQFDGYTTGEHIEEAGGYMLIGDTGYLDIDGYLFVKGRADDMVVIGGENVYPIEVERVIEAIDGVTEAAVFEMEDSDLGHSLVAFVEGSVTVETIKMACAAHLSSFKVPRRIEVLAELPRTATGKVLKRELRQRLGS